VKLALALAFQNEAAFLRLHLPALRLPDGWGFVGLDGGSADDSAEIVRAHGGTVHARSFDWHFGAHMNALIAACEAEGYSALLRLDPDELVFPDVFVAVEQMLAQCDCVALPRYGFIADRCHHNPKWWPDHQVRALRLGIGLRYDGAVHEQLNYQAGYRLGFLKPHPRLHIYHYGWLLPLAQRREREGRYAALQGGNPDPAAHLTDGYPYSEPFVGDQPLDPATIGEKAPYSEVGQ